MFFDPNVTLVTLPLAPPQIWQMANFEPYLGCPLCDVLLIVVVTQLGEQCSWPTSQTYPHMI